MDHFFDKGLVSIIMLSHGDSTHVVETVKSILAQTYQNWELLFVAKTNDETLESLSSLREEDVKIQKMAGKVLTDSYSNSRIKASFIVGEDNDTPRRNSALANAQGRWIAFLDPGDIWEPTKLEKQIGFMEEHGYTFSYTQYGIIDKDAYVGRNSVSSIGQNQSLTSLLKLNYDHMLTSMACQKAIQFQRRLEVKPIKEFWYMDVPSCTDWALNSAMYRFQPNTWVEVGKEGVDAKVKALSMYRGVMRPYPHPRSAEAIGGLAAYRGGQAGYNYAEAFEVVMRRI